MKKKVVKYSAVSPAMRKLVRQTLEEQDVQFFSFPYKGGMEEGFLLEGEENGEPINFLVIVDDEKKSTYKPEDDEDEEEDDDFEDEIEEVDGVVDEDAPSDEEEDNYDNDNPDDDDESK